jgi:hypothetical protein
MCMGMRFCPTRVDEHGRRCESSGSCILLAFHGMGVNVLETILGVYLVCREAHHELVAVTVQGMSAATAVVLCCMLSWPHLQLSNLTVLLMPCCHPTPKNPKKIQKNGT